MGKSSMRGGNVTFVKHVQGKCTSRPSTHPCAVGQTLIQEVIPSLSSRSRLQWWHRGTIDGLTMLVGSYADVIVFESSQIMPSKPCTINVHQLRSNRSRMVLREKCNPPSGRAAPTWCKSYPAWVAASSTSCSCLQLETNRGTLWKWSLTACIQSKRLVHAAGAPPSRIVVSSSKAAGLQLSTWTRKVNRMSSGDSFFLSSSWFSSGAVGASFLSFLSLSTLGGPKSTAKYEANPRSSDCGARTERGESSQSGPSVWFTLPGFSQLFAACMICRSSLGRRIQALSSSSPSFEDRGRGRTCQELVAQPLQTPKSATQT